eukprot:3175059-Amphidinium_carterae.1
MKWERLDLCQHWYAMLKLRHVHDDIIFVLTIQKNKCVNAQTCDFVQAPATTCARMLSTLEHSPLKLRV